MKPFLLCLFLGLLFTICAILAIVRHESGYAVGWTSMFAFFFLGLAKEYWVRRVR